MKLLAAVPLSLLSLASATQEKRQSDSPFTLNIRWSNSPLKGPINANGGSFWKGKETATCCPTNVPGCQTVNTTSFVSKNGNLHLNTRVPGGQQVYVSPTGQLTYTVPHSGNIPADSLTNLPVFSTNSFLNPFLTYWLCSTDSDYNQWNIWLEYTNVTTGSTTNHGQTDSNACTRIALEAVPYQGNTTWEYS